MPGRLYDDSSSPYAGLYFSMASCSSLSGSPLSSLSRCSRTPSTMNMRLLASFSSSVSCSRRTCTVASRRSRRSSCPLPNWIIAQTCLCWMATTSAWSAAKTSPLRTSATLMVCSTVMGMASFFPRSGSHRRGRNPRTRDRPQWTVARFDLCLVAIVEVHLDDRADPLDVAVQHRVAGDRSAAVPTDAPVVALERAVTFVLAVVAPVEVARRRVRVAPIVRAGRVRCAALPLHLFLVRAVLVAVEIRVDAGVGVVLFFLVREERLGIVQVRAQAVVVPVVEDGVVRAGVPRLDEQLAHRIGSGRRVVEVGQQFVEGLFLRRHLFLLVSSARA